MGFVALEGIDGTGKTTLWSRLAREHKDVVFTREPTHNPIGTLARQTTVQSSHPMTQLFLFMADHAEHTKYVIETAKQQNLSIVTDRYFLSRIAYQSARLPMPNASDFIWSLHKDWTIIPDLTVLLTLDPEIAVERIGSRRIVDWEQAEFLACVQNNYFNAIDKFGFNAIIIDVSESPNKVYQKVHDAITPFITS